MKVKYIIDQKFDNELIWIILSCNDPAGLKSRSLSMGIPLELAKEISNASRYSKIKAEIGELSDRKYHDLGDDFFNKQLVSYQDKWDKINEIYGTEVQRITDYKWKHRIFYVVLSPFHMGTTSNGGNIIARSVSEDSKSQTRITAHEILMAHLWSYFYENFPESKNDETMLFWKLNEITTTLILGVEPKLNRLWTDNQKGIDNFLQNYPQLSQLKNKLRDLYIKRNSFREYIDESVVLLSK